MKDLYRRFISVIVLLGSILVIMQFALGFGSTFLSLDSLLTSTASSLLASTNREITQNIDQAFENMMKVGAQISANDDFKSYTRVESEMAKEKTVNMELSLGRTLSTLSSMGNFCDCCIVFANGTTLGETDAHTTEQFPEKELYEYFSNLSDRDSENFKHGKNGDFSRIYYSKYVNSSTIFLVSMLREELDPIFYDAEENYSLTLRMTTQEHEIVYTGLDDEDIGSTLGIDLTQVIDSDDHVQTIVRGQVIASDPCINGWHITSTISEDTLMAENKNMLTLYIILSAAVIILSAVLLFLLCRQVKKRLTKIQEIEDNLEEYSDIDNINLNG